ncbi:histidine phosphatase family protein [Collinsella sp. TM04-9]|uniref:histidine phosphatase family protein n=1 Tax=unclassified Collinsella TaxID=2637548 RepID=UPI000E4794CF|nr:MULTISPECIES: histidine phosphatase family protein [unclassified Collinsella]RGJ83322.1 histidine phosphatase family protein [Collinsella sp. TM04-9]RGJ93308.1 histidine phosphatase family protein [Collinsella sp. TM04-29]
MPKLYFMRHGQTLFNLLRRKQGWCDSPLTELGIEQAKTVGATLRERGLAFDHAYSSTSERACDTLELAFPDQPYERVKGLKEWNFGKFEGASEDLNPRLPYGDFYKQYDGEGEDEFRERIMATITELVQRPGHESVLCLSHGAAAAQVMRGVGVEPLKMKNRIGNCCVLELDFNPATSTFAFADLYNPYGTPRE